MQQFIPGQRVISDAEQQNGLGTVISVEPRTVNVLFVATGETRTYAVQSAPLTRVAFTRGDRITRHDGVVVQIDEVSQDEGLLVYSGRDQQGQHYRVAEAELDNSMRLNRPSERLFNGQIDADKWFELRYRTRQYLNALAHNDHYGLAGGRTSLIPHQLYIAHEVAGRYAPRVLLADEVGLGKTIEAGMILHQQLLTERARRVLVVVPETLVHQWLVEMLRRFNLHFRIFDQARFDELSENPDDDELDKAETGNPFLGEQLVICSLGFLTSDQQHHDWCLAGEWDLLVVDEAHHLQWSPEVASDEYRIVEQLAQRTDGVLLLTATPEQLGKQSHFARLRLLDPDRFHSFDAFIEEEQSYEPVARVVEDLLQDKPLNQEDTQLIEATFGEGDNRELLEAVSGDDDSAARQELVEHLLDRHGTGRVLFRNTRAAISGFPEREVHPAPLECPAVYQQVYQLARGVHPELLLTPEFLHEAVADELDSDARWSTFDPRIDWLNQQLQALAPAKVLVITAGAETALDIAWHLKNQTGIQAAVFHEGLSIVERDRAAAYFADKETGAQVLVCSEIGSEGRNFQFAHHLVLFDLPLNPDLLEQRIGRLDRIGQTDTIRIHVPYLAGTAQEIMFHWYHEALDAFETTCPAGHAVFSRVYDELENALQTAQHSDELVVHSRALYEEMNAAMQRGRDRLLEYNSCRQHIAARLCEQIELDDSQSDLPDYMESVYDCFGVDNELHSENCIILRPTEHMTHPFPGLHDEGMTVTYDRATALTFEDAHYLTWEHPMVRDAMDLVLMNENGNTAVTAIKLKALPAGSLLLECLFVVDAAPVEKLQAWRYLPPTTIRVLLDEKGRDYAAKLAHESINKAAIKVDARTAVQVIKARLKPLRSMHQQAENIATRQLGSLTAAAMSRARQLLETEIDRLRALQQVNPNVRQSEIDFYQHRLEALTTVISNASLRLDAVRAIVVT